MIERTREFTGCSARFQKVALDSETSRDFALP